MAAGGLRARFRPGSGAAELGNGWRRQRARRGRLWREGSRQGGELRPARRAAAARLCLARLELEQEGEGKRMNQNADVEENGEASRHDVRRDGRRVASPARRRSRYGRRGITVPSIGEHSELI